MQLKWKVSQVSEETNRAFRDVGKSRTWSQASINFFGGNFERPIWYLRISDQIRPSMSLRLPFTMSSLPANGLKSGVFTVHSPLNSCSKIAHTSNAPLTYYLESVTCCESTDQCSRVWCRRSRWTPRQIARFPDIGGGLLVWWFFWSVSAAGFLAVRSASGHRSSRFPDLSRPALHSQK